MNFYFSSFKKHELVSNDSVEIETGEVLDRKRDSLSRQFQDMNRSQAFNTEKRGFSRTSKN